MTIETYDIPFSFEQPDMALNRLFTMLQQVFSQPKIRALQGNPTHIVQCALIIDARRERAAMTERLLASMGYRSLNVVNALEAYTHFLQGTFIPLVVITGDDDPNNRFFLQRLTQQVMQKYTIDLAMIRWSTASSQNLFLPPPQPAVTPLPSVERSSSASHFRVPPTTDVPPIVSRDITPTPDSMFGENSSGGMPYVKMPDRVPLIEQSIGRYHVESSVGQGTIGEVYRAYDRLRGHVVALKAVQTNLVTYSELELPLEGEHIFQREIKILNGLKHANILTVANVGNVFIEGVNFIYKVSPFCEEGNLLDWFNQRGGVKAIAPKEAISIIMQLAEAMQYLHGQHILVQNFKPANLLIQNVASKAGNLRLLLADFAWVPQEPFMPKAVDAFPYIAPERWHGVVSAASDQYALAVLAYGLLTGRPPFQGTSASVMKRLHTTMRPPSPHTLNAALSFSIATTLLRALEKKPEDRFSSVLQFAQTLQRYCR